MKNQKIISEFELGEPRDEFECVGVDITDEMLAKAKIVAYMYGQTIENGQGEEKPYNEKTFPGKAVDILMVNGKEDIIEIFLDSHDFAWDSNTVKDGKHGKLGPDQMQQFFQSEFYEKMLQSLSRKWPTTDPTFQKMFDACLRKQMKTGFDDPDGLFEGEIEEARDFGTEVNQPGKRADLANKDTTGDGRRDYSSTGRKIVPSFGDQNVKGDSGLYYCWPNPKFEFKWSQWKDWTKIKPLCKMSFVYNNRKYGVSLGLFDEQFEDRGFRGQDLSWRPPLAWLTPGECDSIMKLSIVRKFVRQCVKRIKKFIDMTPEQIYEKINNKDKITVAEITKTRKVIKHVVDTALRHNQADTYCFSED